MGGQAANDMAVKLDRKHTDSSACLLYTSGQQLNVERPKALVAQDAQQRGAELHALHDAGTFHLEPGYAPPTSLAEAHQQADLVRGAEVASVAKARSNAHTLFFIPLQSCAYIGATLGAVTAIASMFPRR